MSAVLLAVALCGFPLPLPDGWRAAAAASDNDAVACKLNVVPPHWPAKSRWGPVPEHPIAVELFARSASYDDAVEEMGFEKDEAGQIGFYGRGYFAPAESW